MGKKNVQIVFDIKTFLLCETIGAYLESVVTYTIYYKKTIFLYLFLEHFAEFSRELYFCCRFLENRRDRKKS